jgi:hypothetical protein
MGEQSIYERLEAATSVLGEIVNELAEATYEAIESETLKRVAIAAGVDHTTESSRIIERIGDALQHERDVNREMRRRIAALERSRLPEKGEPAEHTRGFIRLVTDQAGWGAGQVRPVARWIVDGSRVSPAIQAFADDTRWVIAPDCWEPADDPRAAAAEGAPQ